MSGEKTFEIGKILALETHLETSTKADAEKFMPELSGSDYKVVVRIICSRTEDIYECMLPAGHEGDCWDAVFNKEFKGRNQHEQEEV